MQFNLARVFETIAAAVPDQEVLVQGDLRLSYRQLDQQVTAIAQHLAAAGLGVRTERSQLAGHESGQDHLGLYLRNGPHYLAGMLGAYRARLAPFNVNYRYVAEELAYLLRDAGTRALIFHAEFADQVQEVREQVPSLTVLIQVPDESGNPLLPGAVDMRTVLSAAPQVTLPQPSPDDLYVVYTGGTTGMPKGVLWRQDDIFVSSMGGTPYGSTEPHPSYEALAEQARAGQGGMRLLLLAPMMHGAAQWSSFHAICNGGCLVLPPASRALDPAAALRTAEQERVISIPVIGDAMARPLVEELERNQYDLSGVFAFFNGSAPLTAPVRDRLMAALPHVMVLDAVGSSETGIQMDQASAPGSLAEVAVFSPQADTTVVSADYSRVLQPGEGAGWLARRGRVPLGYLGDPEKTARAFPQIDGVRWSIPGDQARLLSDGRIELLGRDSVTINSGGEKIFVEEVERALAHHPSVRDVVVVGRPSQRWGNEVTAIVQLQEGREVSDEDLLTECAKHIARFKMPKTIVRAPQIVRSPSGKADYRWAKQQAVQASE